MKFSIIIPIYNAEKYVSDCFRAISNQTYKDYEIIFVDDGSTDKSGDICDKIALEYPEKVKVLHQKNSRQLISRINGVNAAMGDYCIFVDVDDALADDALKIINAKIDSYGNLDLFIYSFYYEFSDGGKKRADKLFPTETAFNETDDKELLRKFLSTTLLNNVWTKAVKRSVLTGGDYPDYDEYKDLLCSEDRLYSLGILDNAKTALYIDEPLYVYRLTSGSVTRNFSVSAIDKLNAIKLYDIEKEYLLKWEIYDKKGEEKFKAQWFNNMIYVFDKYFNNVKSLKERKQVFDYPWETFINDNVIDGVKDNPFISPVHLKWWKWIKEHRFFRTELFMLKKRLIKKLRKKKK